MRKRIEILHVFSNGNLVKPTGRQKRKHASYSAAVRTLNVGECATVAVCSKAPEPLGWMLEGYGEIERISNTSYSYPRRLLHDY